MVMCRWWILSATRGLFSLGCVLLRSHYPLTCCHIPLHPCCNITTFCPVVSTCGKVTIFFRFPCAFQMAYRAAVKVRSKRASSSLVISQVYPTWDISKLTGVALTINSPLTLLICPCHRETTQEMITSSDHSNSSPTSWFCVGSSHLCRPPCPASSWQGYSFPLFCQMSGQVVIIPLLIAVHILWICMGYIISAFNRFPLSPRLGFPLAIYRLVRSA